MNSALVVIVVVVLWAVPSRITTVVQYSLPYQLLRAFFSDAHHVRSLAMHHKPSLTSSSLSPAA